MNDDLIIKKLLEHDERFDRWEEKMATKDDMREIKNTLDVIVTEIKKIRDDHVFAVEWLKRLQTQVEKQEDDIRQIKLKLQMA